MGNSNSLNRDTNDEAQAMPDDSNSLNRDTNDEAQAMPDDSNSLNRDTNDEAQAMSDEPPTKKRKLEDDSSISAGGSDDVTQSFAERDQDTLSLQPKIKRPNEATVTKDEYNELERKYQEEKTAKDEALRRLSAITSSKLRNNSKDVTELMERNKRTKIADKLSELYNNQWPLAYDALERKRMSEEDIIRVLLKDILMKSYRLCKVISTVNYFEKVQRCIELPLKREIPTASVSVLPDYLKQQIKEFRKVRAVHVIKDLEKAIKNELQSPYSNEEAVSKYISGCVEISWLLAVQDPPLVLSTEASVPFDAELFKYYTRRGPYVEYVVWPALFLNKGGALLTKGVAQGCEHSCRRF